jgi:comEA protein
MLNLTRHEKIVLVFLTTSALLGVCVLVCKKISQRVDVAVVTAEIPAVSDGEIRRQIGDSLCVDINKASVERIETLPGIGRELARRVVEYRNSRGLFKTIDEVKNVPGIGEKKFEQIRPYLKIE